MITNYMNIVIESDFLLLGSLHTKIAQTCINTKLPHMKFKKWIRLCFKLALI
jgi:hypothetical protein